MISNGFAFPKSLSLLRDVPTRLDSAGATQALIVRQKWALPIIAMTGVVVCIGQLLMWSMMGAWPFHDVAAFWLSGVHFREGLNPYAGDVGYMTMLYAPPWVVLMSVLSFLPAFLLEIALLAAQVVALRFVAGSWMVFGLLCWLPFTPREFATGNMDFLIGAGILLALRKGSTSPAVLFAFAKFAPILAVFGPGARRREALITGVLLFAVTLPWLSLWPQWIEVMSRAQAQVAVVLPVLPRIPVVAALLFLRRPWSVALAAGLATPGFYIHSFVMLYPGLRMWMEPRLQAAAAREAARAMAVASTGSRATGDDPSHPAIERHAVPVQVVR